MKKLGFAPAFDENSRLLILGSFPSVKSRQVEFYYGNKQNRFWRLICGYFKENIPETTADKKEFLKKHRVALCDIVTACEIEGSSDISIKNAEIADLQQVQNQVRIDIEEIHQLFS